MGVVGETGTTRPPLGDSIARDAAPDTIAARARRHRETLAVDGTVRDPSDLTQAGWAVLFASDEDRRVKEALQPLLDWRRTQVGHDRLFRVFEGDAGFRPRQTVSGWTSSKGVTVAAPVRPTSGVPYYLLIVGSPARIPFEFQQQLDLQWAVGRLSFDDVQAYADYAASVIEYEKGRAPRRARAIASWMPRNPGDPATAMLAGTFEHDFSGAAGDPPGPIGRKEGFRAIALTGDPATKDALSGLFSPSPGTLPPAIVFTGSHGAEWESANAALQRRLQGALVTQQWTPGQPLAPEHYFAGQDLGACVAVHGLIAFLFACFGAGCPAEDSYYKNAAGAKLRLAAEPFVAHLPKELLRRGALAVVSHVDRAFSYGFQDTLGTSQPQLLRTPLERLMAGDRVGMAVDALNAAWASLAAQYGVALGALMPGAKLPASLLSLVVARDDARNYVVLGDPAVRLDVGRLG